MQSACGCTGSCIVSWASCFAAGRLLKNCSHSLAAYNCSTTLRHIDYCDACTTSTQMDLPLFLTLLLLTLPLCTPCPRRHRQSCSPGLCLSSPVSSVVSPVPACGHGRDIQGGIQGSVCIPLDALHATRSSLSLIRFQMKYNYQWPTWYTTCTIMLTLPDVTVISSAHAQRDAWNSQKVFMSDMCLTIIIATLQ